MSEPDQTIGWVIVENLGHCKAAGCVTEAATRWRPEPDPAQYDDPGDELVDLDETGNWVSQPR